MLVHDLILIELDMCITCYTTTELYNKIQELWKNKTITNYDTYYIQDRYANNKEILTYNKRHTYNN